MEGDGQRRQFQGMRRVLGTRYSSVLRIECHMEPPGKPSTDILNTIAFAVASGRSFLFQIPGFHAWRRFKNRPIASGFTTPSQDFPPTNHATGSQAARR